MRYFFYSCILVCLMVTSCEEQSPTERIPPDEVPDGIPNDTALSLSVSVEGVPLEPDQLDISRIQLQGVALNRIYARNTSTQQELEIQFPAAIGSGTYQFTAAPDIGDFVFSRYTALESTGNIIRYTSQSGLLLLQKDVVGEVRGNTVYTLSSPQGSVVEVTFCEFLIN